MIQQRVKKLIRQIANELNIPYSIAEKAVESQFEYIKMTMGEGVHDDQESFKNIQLLHFGKFVVKPGRLNYLNKKKNGTTNGSGEDSARDSKVENN